MAKGLARFIVWRFLLGSFLIGILIVLLSTPEKMVIYRFPAPGTEDVYTSKDGRCYRYSTTPVDCSDYSPTQIKQQPLSLGDELV